MTGRLERLREQARHRQRQEQERINRGKVKPPSNDDALAKIGATQGTSGADNAAALAKLATQNMTGIESLVEGHRANGETPEQLTPNEAVERFIDQIIADPKLERSLDGRACYNDGGWQDFESFLRAR
jgi:hypothetical protein